ncbi:AraC family ligand binding domain-containing protein [Paenibacillus sp. GCM10023248]|uniref:AraC family transcriptional regulator n=1 Tax=Bacillales TaxID=1385 RepID=UPI002378B8E3|nr:MULTISPECIES: AraC family transcriptional regulator [Bacillales]MDD9270618.1 AraC family transcriptional regulator [Paenibacillus sp. MAHUQ-63]MDR6884712.1 AraC-like DNA-binding protein [Bacillus sp. 3255]
MPNKESYYVVSNPLPPGEGALTVLFAGESQTKPVHRLGPKVYDYYLIHYVISGRGVFSSRGEEYELGPGDSFVIEPEQLISYVSDEHDPWHYCWIAFTGEQASELIASAGINPLRPIIHNTRNRHIPVIFRHIQRALRTRHTNAQLKSIGYLYQLLGEYCEALSASTAAGFVAEAESDRVVQQAIHYLSTQYAEPITIEMMAESLGYNRAYLSRLFKRHTKVTPVTFLLKLRVDKARQLLRERLELTIEQISSSVGFYDPLYFSKQFRRLYGVSPSEYRNQIKSL